MTDEINGIRDTAVAVSAEMYNALIVSAHRYRVLVETILRKARWYTETGEDGYVSSADLLVITKAFEPQMFEDTKAAFFAKKVEEEKEVAEWKAKLIAEKVQGDIWSGDEADKPGDEEEEF